MFSLYTKLIPDLRRNGITFRYIGGLYDPKTIIVMHKNLDICRVDMNCNLDELCNYNVYWFPSIVKNARCLRKKYTFSDDLIDDICEALKEIYSEGEDKMDKKMYVVTDMYLKSTPYEKDEIDFTVSVMRQQGATREDAERIREAIESIKTHDDSIDALMYCKTDIISTYRLLQMFNKTSIKDVIFNNPATIVLWADGTKTVVKAENEPFDPEKGLAMAIAKKALGNNYDYYDIFKKYVGKYEKKQAKTKKGGK